MGVTSIDVLPILPRIANALVSYVAYLGQFFYPLGLAIVYPYPQDGLPVWKVAAGGLLLAGISLAVLACRRKCPYLPMGWFWYLGMLVPVIGLVQVGTQAMADRYTYLTQIGLYVALAWGMLDLSRRWPSGGRLCGAAAAMVAAVLACCAWLQVSYWKDDVTLWPHTLACTSNNWLAHNSLGVALAGRGRRDEGIDHFRMALTIKGNYEMAHHNLGALLAARGQVDEALAHLRLALEIKPDYAKAHQSLGILLASRGQVAEAAACYRKALNLARQQNNPALAESVQAQLQLLGQKYGEQKDGRGGEH